MKENNYKIVIICICFIYCCSMVLAQDYQDYQMMIPGADVNSSPSGDISWMAAAANMLAGAGYGFDYGNNINTLQKRADHIFADIKEGYPDDNDKNIMLAIQWWLTSNHNVWQDNPYDMTRGSGNTNCMPHNDPELPKIIANTLREANFVGLNISWPKEGNEVPGEGDYALTAWGDNNPSYSKLYVNPTHIIVTDPDESKGSGEQKYQYLQKVYTGDPSNGWELTDYDGLPFITQYSVLFPQPDVDSASGTKTIDIDTTRELIGLKYTAYQKEDDIYVLSYLQTLDIQYSAVEVIEDNNGKSDNKIHAIDVEYSGITVTEDRESIKIRVDFILNSKNTVRFRDVTIIYQDGEEKVSPDTGWEVTGTQRNGNSPPCPERGFIVAAFTTRTDSMRDVEDMLLHEFDETVEFNTHNLEICNDETDATVTFSSIKTGYSDIYLNGDQLANFNNWIDEDNTTTYPVSPGNSIIIPIDLPDPPYKSVGDVNSDGEIDIVDALLIAQYYVGLDPSDFNSAAADTNYDGNIDIVDALLIAQYYVGIIPGLCP